MADYVLALLPIVSVLAIMTVFGRRLQRATSGHFDFFELGFIFAATVCLYLLFPVLSFVANGMSFPFVGDNRLFLSQPDVFAVSYLAWFYVLFLAAFVVAYLRIRGKGEIRTGDFPSPPIFTGTVIILFYILCKLFFVALTIGFDLPAPTSYGGSYLTFIRLPLVLQQVASRINGAMLIIQIALVVLAMRDAKKRKLVVFLWLTSELVFTFWRLGARTTLFMLLITTLISYHYLVRKMAWRTVVVFALCGISLFLGLGYMRSSSSARFSETPAGSILSTATEFDSLFATAEDLQRRKQNGETSEVIPRLYYADFTGLIPQQLFIFGDKLDVAAWYVKKFYPLQAAGGAGFAFGVVAESIVGLGYFDVVWRGAALGLLFGYLQRRFVRRKRTYWSFIFHIWITVFAYQCFRASTFYLFSFVVYSFVPVYLLINLSAGIFKWATLQGIDLRRTLPDGAHLGASSWRLILAMERRKKRNHLTNQASARDRQHTADSCGFHRI